MQKKIEYLIVLALFTFLPMVVHGQDSTAFVVDSLVVHHGTSPHLNDTVNLVFAFKGKAVAGGWAKIHLHFPGSVAPPDQQAGETERDSSILITPGIPNIYTFPLKLFHYGGSLVEVTIRSDSVHPSVKGFSGGYFETNLTSSTFSLEYGESSSTNDTIPVTMESPDSTPMAHLHITGKVDYEDQWQADSNFDFPLTKGVYGDTVILIFYKRNVSAATDSSLSLGAFFPYPGCDEHIHYSVCDTGGNFSFDFTAQLPNWNGYVDVALIPTKGNSAALMQTGRSYTITGLGCGDRTTFTRYYSKVLSIAPNTININYTDQEISLNFDDGGILRNCQLSQEFDRVRPVDTVPLRINTYVLSSSFATSESGIFYSNWGGGGNPPGIGAVTEHASSHVVSHEWGHWLNYNYTPATFEGSYKDFTEGFAIFHQFCVRNYTSAKYNEFQDWTRENLEESPFNFNSLPNDISSRYSGIGYAATSYETAAFGCFLWDVYDKSVDDGFRAVRYNDSDNDDVGEPSLIWDKFASLDTSTLYNITGPFKNLLKSAVDTVEARSIEDIYEFMFGYGDTLMRPAQVKNLGISINVDEEIGGGEEPIIFYHYYPVLTWTPQNYVLQDNPLYDYSNAPDSVHIYNGSSSTGPWVLDTTVAIDDTPVTLPQLAPIDSAYYIGSYFKVSTFDASGDAYNAPVVDEPAYKKANGQGNNTLNTASISVSVHPNPSSSTTKICVEDLPEGVPATVEIVNLMGEAVTTLYNATPEAELGLCLSLDCSRMPPGTYYARVVNDIMGTTVKFSVEH